MQATWNHLKPWVPRYLRYLRKAARMFIIHIDKWIPEWVGLSSLGRTSNCINCMNCTCYLKLAKLLYCDTATMLHWCIAILIHCYSRLLLEPTNYKKKIQICLISELFLENFQLCHLSLLLATSYLRHCCTAAQPHCYIQLFHWIFDSKYYWIRLNNTGTN